MLLIEKPTHFVSGTVSGCVECSKWKKKALFRVWKYWLPLENPVQHFTSSVL